MPPETWKKSPLTRFIGPHAVDVDPQLELEVDAGAAVSTPNPVLDEEGLHAGRGQCLDLGDAFLLEHGQLFLHRFGSSGGKVRHLDHGVGQVLCEVVLGRQGHVELDSRRV